MLGFQKRIRLWYDKLGREYFKKLIFIPTSFVGKIGKVYTLRVFFSRFNSSLIRKMSQSLRLLKCKLKYFLEYRRLSGVTKRWQVPSAAYEHYHLLECVSSAAGHDRFTLLLAGTWVVENLTTVSNFRVDCSEVELHALKLVFFRCNRFERAARLGKETWLHEQCLLWTLGDQWEGYAWVWREIRQNGVSNGQSIFARLFLSIFFFF